MRPESDEILEIANKKVVEIDCKCIFGELVDGYWEDSITYREEIISLKITDSQNDTKKGLQLGTTISARLDLVIYDVEVKSNDRVKPYIRFKKSDGTHTAWIGLGYFYVRTCPSEDKIFTITAYDRMIQLDKRYKTNLYYPAKMSEMLAEMVERRAFNLADSVSCDESFYISKKPENMTYRDVIGYIASANGGCAKFDRYNKLYFTQFADTDTVIAAENCFSLTPQETPYTVDYVNIKSTDSNWYIKDEDEDTNGVIDFYNPWGTSDMAAKITAKLHGLSYYGCELTCQGTAVYDIGDRVKVKIVDGSEIPILITGMTRTISNGAFTESIVSSAATEAEQADDYVYDAIDIKATNADDLSINPLEEFVANADGSYTVNGVNYKPFFNKSGKITTISDSKGNVITTAPTYAEANSNIDFNTMFMTLAALGMDNISDMDYSVFTFEITDDDLTLTIPILSDISADGQIDWGDNEIDVYDPCAEKSHTYDTPGTYSVKIYANISYLRGNGYVTSATTDIQKKCTSVILADCIEKIIHNSFSGIGDYVSLFSYSDKLNYFKGGKKLSVLCVRAFSDCKLLKTVSFSHSLSFGTYNNSGELCSYAFLNCYKLMNVFIPDGTVKISGHTFQFCNKLTSIYIPKSVVELGSYCLYSCGAITINYEGSEAEWNALTKRSNWSSYTTISTINYNQSM